MNSQSGQRVPRKRKHQQTLSLSAGGSSSGANNRVLGIHYYIPVELNGSIQASSSMSLSSISKVQFKQIVQPPIQHYSSSQHAPPSGQPLVQGAYYMTRNYETFYGNGVHKNESSVLVEKFHNLQNCQLADANDLDDVDLSEIVESIRRRHEDADELYESKWRDY